MSDGISSRSSNNNTFEFNISGVHDNGNSFNGMVNANLIIGRNCGKNGSAIRTDYQCLTPRKIIPEDALSRAVEQSAIYL